MSPKFRPVCEGRTAGTGSRSACKCAAHSYTEGGAAGTWPALAFIAAIFVPSIHLANCPPPHPPITTVKPFLHKSAPQHDTTLPSLLQQTMRYRGAAQHNTNLFAICALQCWPQYVSFVKFKVLTEENKDDCVLRCGGV
jgi:hypothetical protein